MCGTAHVQTDLETDESLHVRQHMTEQRFSTLYKNDISQWT